MHLHVCCMLVAGYECIFIKYHPMPTIIRASSWCKGRIIWFCVHCTKCTEFYHREMRGVNRNQTKKRQRRRTYAQQAELYSINDATVYWLVMLTEADSNGIIWPTTILLLHTRAWTHTHTYHSVSDNLHGSQTIIPIIIILPKHQSQRIKIKKPSSSVKFTSTWVWLGFNIHISRWEARNMLW